MKLKQRQHIGQFSDLGIREKLLDILDKKQFKIPTPIQHQVIPGALKGKDVVGIAQTGTGKTLAFGIPMIQRIALNKGQGLILVPTRELALQVDKALRDIGSPLGLRTAVVIGGVSQHRQAQALRRDPHIVIATPGRLADLMNQGVYKLNKLTIVTLDEADRMLDVGFLPQIKDILKTAPLDRQTLLFSATMPKTISSLATEFMKMPLRIEIVPQGTSLKNIDQGLYVVTKSDKMRLLNSLLQQYDTNTTLIFSRTKFGAKRIARDVRGMGHTATEIHSNRSQAQRKAALAGFTKGKFRVLVATDIASRGIDVKDISLVINFDLPDNTEDYVHRIGRTGRAGRHGKAISFVTTSEKADVKKIERLIRKTLPVLALPELTNRVTPQKAERKVRPARHTQSSRRSRSRQKPSSKGNKKVSGGPRIKRGSSRRPRRDDDSFNPRAKRKKKRASRGLKRQGDQSGEPKRNYKTGPSGKRKQRRRSRSKRR